MRRASIAFGLALAGLLAGCGKPPAPAPQATVSIRDLMLTMVDPSADALWASVGSTVSAKGSVDLQPRTEAEWQAVRAEATLLTEAPVLLSAPGRQVALPGQKTGDADVPGIQAPAVIQAQIEADRPKFEGLALGLQTAGRKALAAADAKDPVALLEAGAALDEACEACHHTYWYPLTPKPKVPRGQS